MSRLSVPVLGPFFRSLGEYSSSCSVPVCHKSSGFKISDIMCLVAFHAGGAKRMQEGEGLYPREDDELVSSCGNDASCNRLQ